MVAPQIEKEEIIVCDDQVLYGSDGGGRGRCGVKKVSADQDSADSFLSRITAEPPERIQQLCPSLRSRGRVIFCPQIRIQMQIAAMNDLHCYSFSASAISLSRKAMECSSLRNSDSIPVRCLPMILLTTWS